jgi:hypothetical protein
MEAIDGALGWEGSVHRGWNWRMDVRCWRSGMEKVVTRMLGECGRDARGGCRAESGAGEELGSTVSMAVK